MRRSTREWKTPPRPSGICRDPQCAKRLDQSRHRLSRSSDRPLIRPLRLETSRSQL
ncbi:MAG: hypothetical protein AVDCRST_MAG88-2719 [uncultured Thermomicrobiales bacterium]|uniref:Uncharacterized protein n=1 Tax=uncultured Thermomicrobiales bacterium TaxID=1645740 RepID=A0A6J4VBN1_9BACT|nr:MAG: hypothetical protein AVDCRST_MAG88-2719 [uncultured Thermomicrobiales bacterium]